MFNYPEFTIQQAYKNECKRSIQFIEKSLEWSPYVTKTYIEHSAKSNGFADVFVLYDGDKPLVGVPLHKAAGNSFTTGYSGLLFPPVINERQAIKACNLLKKFFDSNKLVAFSVCHQPRGVASRESRKRNNLIDFAFASVFNLDKYLYTRLIYLNECEYACKNLEAMFPLYHAELRNQIRKARKTNVTIEIIDSKFSDIEKLINSTEKLYNDSRRRTNLNPRPLCEIIEESRNLIKNNFKDIWVVAKNNNNEIVSVVNCHLFSEKAIYNLNYSSEAGYKLNANPMALDAAINYCHISGALIFETGRFNIGEKGVNLKEDAISRYKSQFGGDPIKVISFRYNSPAIYHIIFAKYIRKKFKRLVGYLLTNFS